MGHGNVTKNADGSMAKCGGPYLCKICQDEERGLAPKAVSIGQKWQSPYSKNIYTMTKGVGWVLTQTDRRPDIVARPAERDVPHWAVKPVLTVRVENGIGEIVTDRMIFNALYEAMNDPKALELNIAKLHAWAIAQPAPAPKIINKLTSADVASFIQVSKHVHVDMLNHYQEISTRSAIYPGQGTPLGLAYVALKLNGEAGEFAEHVGKAMRDDGFFQSPDGEGWDGAGEQLTPERKALIVKEIGDVLWYLSAACNELGIKLSAAAAANLHKLAERTEKGTLQGSGDNR